MRITLDGSPQEIMAFLASLASTPQLLEQHVTPQIEHEPTEPVEEKPEQERAEQPPIVIAPTAPKHKPKVFRLHPKNANGNSLKERAFQFIKDHPGTSTKDISEFLGRDADCLNPRIQELIRAKRVGRLKDAPGRVGYFVTPEALGDRPAEKPTIGFPDLSPKRPGPPTKTMALKSQILHVLRDRGPMPASRLRQYLTVTSNNLYSRLVELKNDGRVARIPGNDGRFIYRALPEEASSSAD